jgi:hypothetical protein
MFDAVMWQRRKIWVPRCNEVSHLFRRTVHNDGNGCRESFDIDSNEQRAKATE